MITSGNLTPVMDGGGGNHSVFARGLLEVFATETGIFSSTALFGKLQRIVTDDALSNNVTQTPTISALNQAGHIGPDFVFYSQERF